MKFLNPAGLWLLIGIPILIVVCLIRPKYMEKTVGTTYLWQLSRKYRKERLPVRQAKKLLLLLLQILIIAVSALLLAQPRITVEGSGHDWIAVLDTSAGMRMTDSSGASRLDRAKQALLNDLEAQPFGTRFTLAVTSDPSVLLADRTDSAAEVRYAVQRVGAAWDAHSPQQVMETVQRILWQNPAAEVVLYTDRDWHTEGNIRICRVDAQDEWNVSLSGLAAQISAGGVRITHEAVSYGRDAQLTLALYVDGKLTDARTVSLNKDEKTEIEWRQKGISAFTRISVSVKAEDGLREDNEAVLLRRPARSNSILLCSEAPLYTESALKAFSANQVTVSAVIPEELSGYVLYVFDGLVPDTLPKDGAVLIINPEALPKETGLKLGSHVPGGNLRASRELTGTAAEWLADGLLLTDASVLRLHQVKDSGQLLPVLYCGDEPAMLAGTAPWGQSLCVLPFDLHDSNLPMLSAWVRLVSNLLDEMLPEMLSQHAVQCGETLTARVLPGSNAMYLQAPDGSLTTVVHENEEVGLVIPTPGVWTLLQTDGGDQGSYEDFAAYIAPTECCTDPATDDTLLSLSVSAADEETLPADERLWNPTIWLCAALLLLMLLEWTVHYHEQYGNPL